MNIVERVKKICLTPAAEWPVIATENTPAGTLISGYVLPLAAIGVVCGFIGGSIIGRSLPFIGTYRVPFVAGFAAAIFTLAMTVAGVFVLSLIINALAPSFGAEKNQAQALKVAAYSFTPAWVAGVLQILPLLGVLVLFAALYGIYILYLGLPRLMKCPEDKAVGYTVVVVVCAIVVNVVISLTGGLIIGAGALATGGLTSGAGLGSASPDVEFDKNSPLGKLQELGRGLEESAKKAEAAEKRGDQGAQVAAAVEGLGTLLGGGKRVEPMALDQLKAFVPETFAGMPKRSSSAEKTGFGITVAKAEAVYGDGAEKEVTLEVLDTGGASGLVGFASWMGVQEEKENDDGYERTQNVNGRFIHEKMSKSGSNEFGVVMGSRFVVSARGRGVDVNALKAAITSLELGKLEAMKDVGVTK